MNRRDFLLIGGAGVFGATILSPQSLFACAISETAGITPLEALQTPAWLKRFQAGSTAELFKRRRFRLFMDGAFPGMTAPFWFDKPAYTTAHAFMSSPGVVWVSSNRYVIATGSMAGCASNQALLWVDTTSKPNQAGIPHAVLIFMDVGSQPRRRMWIFDNHFVAGGGTAQVIPGHLRRTIRRWIDMKFTRRAMGGRINVVSNDTSTLTMPIDSPSIYGVPPKWFLSERVATRLSNS